MMIGWVLLVIFILLLFIWLDFYLGKKTAEQRAPFYSRELVVDDYQLLTEGDTFFSCYFKDIAQAKRTILISFFIVGNDAISQEFLKLLQQKAQAGVHVQLLLDWIGSISIKKKWLKRLKQSGVIVKKANPPKVPFLLYRLNQRNHRKITVIDSQICYLGGFNIGKKYKSADPKLGHWKDYHICIKHHPLANTLEKIFFYDWSKSDQALSDSNFAHKDTDNSILTITEAGQLEQNLIAWIDQASESIVIGSPYFIPTKPVFTSLLTALHRGVRLTILAPEKADHPFVKAAALPFYKKLLPLGATIYLYDHGFYHAKVILIDQNWCDIGTANFDQRSLLFNQEINLLFTDPKLVQPVQQSLANDIANSFLLTDTYLEELPLATKFASILSRLFRAIL